MFHIHIFNFALYCILSSHYLSPIFNNVQVAMIPSNATEPAEVRSLTTSLAKLSTELESVSSKQELASQLLQTKLGTQEARQYLQTKVLLLKKRFVANCKKMALQAWKCHGAVVELLSKLPQPSCKREEEYRSEASKHATPMAQQAADICQNVASIRHFKQDLMLLEPVAFLAEKSPGSQQPRDAETEAQEAEAKPEAKEPEAKEPEAKGLLLSSAFENAGGDEESFFKQCDSIAVVAKVHVTLIAAISLLRHPQFGNPSQIGKQLLEKLGPVLSTLQGHLETLKPIAPPGGNEFKLWAFAELILVEAQDALKGGDSKQKTAAKDSKDSKHKKPTPSAEVDSTPKDKKRKGNEPDASEKEAAAAATKKADKDKKTKKKKKKDDEEADDAPEAVAAEPEPKPKKAKKGK